MPKLLLEFLQEQQEPFSLEDYLLERGYSKGTTGLNYASSTFRRNSAQFLKKSASRLCVRKRRNFVPKCSEFVKAVCSRLIVLQHNHKIKNLENGGRRNSNNTREISEEEHADDDKIFSSSASGTNVFDSCSESDVGEEDAHCSQVEADAERKSKWRSTEDCNRKLSPVSILEETEPDEEDSPFHDKGECSTSVPQCKSKQPTHYYSVKELEEFVVGSNSYSQFIINKRALQKKKQLLIDCVREVIENHRKRDDERKQRRQLKKILGAEELWKLVCENVWVWSQDSIDETNIAHLLRCDLMASLQEWSAHSEQHKEEVSIDIGDAILESMINEIITS